MGNLTKAKGAHSRHLICILCSIQVASLLLGLHETLRAQYAASG